MSAAGNQPSPSARDLEYLGRPSATAFQPTFALNQTWHEGTSESGSSRLQIITSTEAASASSR